LAGNEAANRQAAKVSAQQAFGWGRMSDEITPPDEKT
jgi:hypothetical protein